MYHIISSTHLILVHLNLCISRPIADQCYTSAVTSAIAAANTTVTPCNFSDANARFMYDLRKPSSEAARQGRLQTLYDKVVADAQMAAQNCSNTTNTSVPVISSLAREKICAVENCQVPSISSCGEPSPYYSYTGSCNNRRAPTQGNPATPLRRLIPMIPGFEPTGAIPSQTVTLSSNVSYSKMLLLWKQFIDHDLYLLPEMEGDCS